MSQTEPVAVHSITGAKDPHSQDLNIRVRRYLISMAIRTVCVVLAVVVPGPLRWVFIVGAVVLPYVAVIMANSTGQKRGTRTGPAQPEKVALPAQQSPAVVVLGPAGDPDPDAAPMRQSAEWLRSTSAERTP